MKQIVRPVYIALILLFFTATSVFALPDKRVGIVYSEPSANQFYDEFAYTQLFMSMQNQARMAGIPYDLLSEDDLTSSTKLSAYDALIIPSMQYVTSTKVPAIEQALGTAVSNGMGLIVSGNLMTNSSSGGSLSNAYSRMQQWLGINAPSGGVWGAALDIRASDVSHPVMRDYSANEVIHHYDQNQIWVDIYQPVAGQNASVLAILRAGTTNHNGVLATQTGGRNVHFANDQVMGDTNIVWSALQWVVYGNEMPVGLKLSRQNSLFIARNDMDSTKYADLVDSVIAPLYDLLVGWKNSYNFIGSYYLNIGDRPSAGEYTDWAVSGPLYHDYLSLGNEIGTHSWSHPDNTANLSSAELEYEFNQSKIEISSRLGIDVIGAAIPGNPESIEVDQQIQAYFDYVSGRSGVINDGYPGAIGRMWPGADMVYFSLNLSPDYTLIEWLGNSASQATTIWHDEFYGLLNHASQPIIHWLWHDYGPTVGGSSGYTLAMYTNTIAMAKNSGSEFVTLADLYHRIIANESATLTVTGTDPVTADVNASGVGQFSLMVRSNQVIRNVSNWYAYDDDQIFLPDDGGQFVFQMGSSQDDVTHITALPMRARLMSLSGNGDDLAFNFDGSGTVSVHLSPALASDLTVDGSDGYTHLGNQLSLYFNSVGLHTVDLAQVNTSNEPPVATGQSVSLPQDSNHAIALIATDPDNDPLTYSIVNGPVHGQLTGVAPNLTYTPVTDFSGADSFTFKANDGVLDSNIATVSITVTPVNPPVAYGQSVSLPQDSSIAITLTADDPENDPLTYSIVTAPGHGQLSGTIPSLTYTPVAGYSGNDSFTFKANDGALDSNVATISITVTHVNQPPQANSQSVSLLQDSSIAITLTASDPENNPLTYSIVTGPVHGQLSGTIPSLTYTPVAGYSGNDSFTFKANDGALDSNIATVSISVTPVAGNQPPVANDQSISLLQDSSVAITLTASDAEGSALTYSIVTAPTQGQLSGTAPDLTYIPNAGYSGTDSFTFTANDGTVDSNIATVSITVNPNVIPSVVSIDAVSSGSTNSTSVTISHTTTGSDRLMLVGVSMNNRGLETVSSITYNGIPLSYVNSETRNDDARVEIWMLIAPPKGTYNVVVTFSANLRRDAVVGVTTFTGVDQTDPLGTFARNNARSNAATVTATTAVDEMVFGVFSCETCTSVTFSAPTAEQWNIVAGNGIEIGAGATVVASSNQLTINASLGSSDYWAMGAISVKPGVTVPVNNPPVANEQALILPQDSSLGITLTASDPNNDPLTYSVVTAPGNGQLSGVAPNLTYTPNSGFSGNDSFTFKVNDGAIDSNIAMISISVTPVVVNQPPIANNQSVSLLQDSSIAITLTGSDPENVPLLYTVMTNPGQGQITGIAPDLLYTPYIGASGDDSFTFKVNDGALDSNIATVSISITPVVINQPPVANAQTVSLPQDSSVGITLTATDPNGDAMTYSIVTGPGNGQLTGVAPNLSYSPFAGFSGDDNFTFKANDGALDSNVATVSITVTPVISNDPPVANGQTVSLSQGSSTAITLTATDPNGDPLTYTIETAPGHGQLSGIAPDLTYTPVASFSGADSFTFKVNDGALDSNVATVSITVTPVVINEPPVANDQAVSLSQDSSIGITLTATDPNGDPLTYSIDTAPAHGQLSGTAPVLTYTPDAAYSGVDSFTFVANDGGFSSNIATVSITVTASDGSVSNPVTALTVDGNLADWSALTSFGTDPNDVSGSSNLLDWLEGWMAHNDTTLYLAYRNDGNISLSWGQNVYLDTDSNFSTGFNNGGYFPVGAEYLIQAGYLYQYTGNGSTWSWSYVGDLTTVVSGSQAEFSLPRSWIGNPATMDLFFLGENVAYSGGSTEDYYPDGVTDSAASVRYFSYRF